MEPIYSGAHNAEAGGRVTPVGQRTHAPPAVSGSATTTKPDQEAAKQLLARCVAGLKDSAQAARRKALQDVQSALLDNPALGEAWLAEALEGAGLGKALLRRFDDPADGCRELAVSNLMALLRAAPGAVLSLTPYVFPVVEERLRPREEGGKNLTEPCEEVRLGLARLLRLLVQLGGRAFGPYAGDCVGAVEALAADPFHEVQEEACGVVLALNDALGLRLQPVAKQLVAALLPLTTAKRHRVRVAALQALRPTMHQGAHEMILEMVAWRDPNVVAIKAFYGDDLKINFCGKLASDSHPAVRREFLAVLADWMTGLRERLDHESRLLPYVLSALNDEAPEIQEDAVALLERLGVQYEADHEKELRELLAYLPEEAHGIGWQAEGAAGFVYGPVAAGQETVNGGRAVFVLPGPLRQRPRVGTRRLVQSNFPRIVGALADECCSWLAEARRRAAALLRTQLVLAEEWAEQHLHVLVPALAKAISDPEIRPVISDCCAVLGAFSDPALALQLLAPRLAEEGPGAEAAQRAAALEVLAGVVKGAGPRRAMDAHLGPALELLGAEGLLGCEDTRVRRAMYDAVEQLVATCGPACDRHASRLLWVCLHLRAPGRGAAASTPSALGAPSAASVALPEPGVAAAPPSLLQLPLPQQPEAPPGAGGSSADGGGGGLGGGRDVEGLVARLAEVVGCGGGADELVEAHRAELVGLADPGHSPNLLLATGVLCRLMLPYARLSYLLLTPDDLLARVLPYTPPCAPHTHPAAAGGSTPMDVDTAASCGTRPSAAGEAPEAEAVGSSGRGASMELDGAEGGAEDASASPSTSGRRAEPPLFWQPASTVAVLRQAAAQAGWLPRHPRCAAMAVLCLEACLEAAPAAGFSECAARGEGRAAPGEAHAGCSQPPDASAPSSGDGRQPMVGPSEGWAQGQAAGASGGEAGALLAGLLERLLASHEELPPVPLLGALRCAHVALRRGLLHGGALTAAAPRLAACVAGCMAAVGGAACRLQAAHVMRMLLQACSSGAEPLPGESAQGTAAAAAREVVLLCACGAASSRLYDASDEVRCVALDAARGVLESAGRVQGLVGTTVRDAAGRLAAEIRGLRDVVPGSAFAAAHREFAAWAEAHAAWAWEGAGGAAVAV